MSETAETAEEYGARAQREERAAVLSYLRTRVVRLWVEWQRVEARCADEKTIPARDETQRIADKADELRAAIEAIESGKHHTERTTQ